MQRLPDTWREGLKPTAPPPLPQKLYNHSAADSRRTSPLLDIAAYTSPTHERIDLYLIPPWRKTTTSYGHRAKVQPNDTKADSKESSEERDNATTRHIELISELTKSNQNLLVYSDGLLIKKSGFSRTGAAAVVYHEGREIKSEKMGMGGRAEVYDAEMAGLMMGARMAVKYARSHPQINNIYFFADNTAAVRAIFNPKPRTGQLYAARFHKKICHFPDENPEHQMSVSWCPGHTNIKGNERADELATTLQRSGQCEPMQYAGQSSPLNGYGLESGRVTQKQEPMLSQTDFHQHSARRNTLSIPLARRLDDSYNAELATRTLANFADVSSRTKTLIARAACHYKPANIYYSPARSIQPTGHIYRQYHRMYPSQQFWVQDQGYKP